MAGVAATAPDPALAGFPAIFTLLEAGQNPTSNTRLDMIVTLLLGERPPLLVCLDSPEPHIRVLWGTQFFTPSFARPTPEDGKVLAFARDIWLGQLPGTVVMLPE